MTPREELAQLASARTESGLQLFLREAGRYRLLTAAEEVGSPNGSSAATGGKQRMVDSNLRLVVSIAKNYRNLGLPSST